jgi:hypothetical protein
MDDFRTVVSLGVSPFRLGLNDRILTVGSCFADAIGSRLGHYKIATQANPFGTIYNPHAIHKLLLYTCEPCALPENGFIKQNDVYLNYDFHSKLWADTQATLSDKLSGLLNTSHVFLKTASCIIITYGTAWVYKRNDTGDIVANCHKVPAAAFTKALLTSNKITESFDALYKALKAVNPRLNIILTVSPVRHIKETLELNSVSKSILRTACHEITSAYTDVHYFPAYEIMMDDLRDYRFYKSDMIHPSDVAEDYIWHKFTDHFANQGLKEFLVEWKQILAALSHKPFHPASESHQRFLKDLLTKLESYRNTISVESEIDVVKQQMKPGICS